MCGVLVVFAASLLGQPAEKRRAPEKLKPGSSCVAKDCHAKLVGGAVVHRAITKKPCDVCHEQGDETLHKFTFPEEGAALCYGCHKDLTKKKFSHAPLKDKKKPCLRCHEPHSTASKHLIRTATVSAQCLECHTEMAKGPRYHKSRAVKGCTGCHIPHASDAPKLLRAAPVDLCFTCHEDIKEDMGDAKVAHKALRTGCVPCHDPHRPLAGMGLRGAGDVGACVTCHEGFDQKMSAMSKHHPNLLENAGCRGCHQPHFSGRKALLVKSQQTLCLTCHNKDIKTASGRTLKPMGPQLATKGMHLHGPLTDGNCGGCHEPHGNRRSSFLREAYPQKLHTAYAPEAYALCFRCHDRSLAADKYALTPVATGFRNGKVNLHYLHVNKPDRGRTCRACHTNHATKNPHMLADSVPFGTWKIPVGFQETGNGGTCTPGCHRKKGYDRVKPVAPGSVRKPAGLAGSKGTGDGTVAPKPGQGTEPRKPTTRPVPVGSTTSSHAPSHF